MGCAYREDGIVAETPARYCGNCGHELGSEDRFCPNCGTPVSRSATVPTPEADVPVPLSLQQSGGNEATPQEASPEEGPPETRTQELERLIAERRDEEAEARSRAAKLAAKLKGIPREGGTSIDPHTTKTLWGGLALGLLKSSLKVVNERQRESAEEGLRNAEAEEEQARSDRRVLEAELAAERRKEEEGKG